MAWSPGGLAPEPFDLGFPSSSPNNRLSHLPIPDVLLSVKHDRPVLRVPKANLQFYLTGVWACLIFSDVSPLRHGVGSGLIFQSEISTKGRQICS